jgi:hypothetical protein
MAGSSPVDAASQGAATLHKRPACVTLHNCLLSCTLLCPACTHTQGVLKYDAATRELNVLTNRVSPSSPLDANSEVRKGCATQALWAAWHSTQHGTAQRHAAGCRPSAAAP